MTHAVCAEQDLGREPRAAVYAIRERRGCREYAGAQSAPPCSACAHAAEMRAHRTATASNPEPTGRARLDATPGPAVDMDTAAISCPTSLSARTQIPIYIVAIIAGPIFVLVLVLVIEEGEIEHEDGKAGRFKRGFATVIATCVRVDRQQDQTQLESRSLEPKNFPPSRLHVDYLCSVSAESCARLGALGMFRGDDRSASRAWGVRGTEVACARCCDLQSAGARR
jgi:hypothetical protein